MPPWRGNRAARWASWRWRGCWRARRTSCPFLARRASTTCARTSARSTSACRPPPSSGWTPSSTRGRCRGLATTRRLCRKSIPKTSELDRLSIRRQPVRRLYRGRDERGPKTGGHGDARHGDHQELEVVGSGGSAERAAPDGGGALQRGAGQRGDHRRGGRAAPLVARETGAILGRDAHGRERTVPSGRRAGGGFLAVAGQVDGRGGGVGEALPQPGQRRSRDRNPPGVRSGRVRRRAHAGAARAGAAAARPAGGTSTLGTDARAPLARERSVDPFRQRAAVVVLGRAAAGAGVEAANADTAARSCTDMLVTIGFISSAQGPRRAPVFMSKSCRMV